MIFIEQLIKKYPDLEVCKPEIVQAFELLEECFILGGKLLVCGNGGSAADCEHIVGELMKGFYLKRTIPSDLRDRLMVMFPAQGNYLANHLQGALPAISLVSQVSLTTAFINDVAVDTVYAQQVLGYGRPNDIVLGLSTSGNSVNVLHALRIARVLGLKTIGFTGGSCGIMGEVCDVLICIPLEQTPEIQEKHVAVYHALCAALEERFFDV